MQNGTEDGPSAKRKISVDVIEISGVLIFAIIAIALSEAGFQICSFFFDFLTVGCGIAILIHHINKVKFRYTKILFVSLILLDSVLFTFLSWHTHLIKNVHSSPVGFPQMEKIESTDTSEPLANLSSSQHTESQSPEGATLITQQEERGKQNVEKAEKEAKDYKERYLMPVEQQQNISAPRIVVVAVSQNQIDTAMVEPLGRMAKQSGFFVVDNLLKPDFITDGLFDKAFNGGFDSLDGLDLTNNCDFLALCQLTFTISSRPYFQANVAAGKMQIRLFRTGIWKLVSSQEYEANAAAFKSSEAIVLVRNKFINLLMTNSFPYKLK